MKVEIDKAVCEEAETGDESGELHSGGKGSDRL